MEQVSYFFVRIELKNAKELRAVLPRKWARIPRRIQQEMNVLFRGIEPGLLFEKVSLCRGEWNLIPL
jgi:hypothetical protein